MNLGLILSVAAAGNLLAQTGWPALGNDPGSIRYSSLKAINAGNVANLKPAWTWDSGEKATSEVTPLVIGGIMYVSTPGERVVALDAETGAEIWRYDPKAKTTGGHRGVSYWPGDKQTPPRIVVGTTDGRLLELEAKTGKLVLAFGDNGAINLRLGVADKYPESPYGPSSPPAIYRDLAILGSRLQDGPSHGPSGDVRAYDLRTGKLAWTFQPIPRPGEPGNDTWGSNGWKDRSGPSIWGPITVDQDRGMVFLPTGNPADAFYGVDRPGSNLYANCIVALDASTGKLRWYYQVVHHDLWDYDVSAPPALIESEVNGKKVPAVAALTKHGMLFILDRMTGRPVFGVEERVVPKSDVPGEQTSPTQPFPLKPPPLARMTLTREELSKVTPKAEKFCAELFDADGGMHNNGPFTPYGMKPTVNYPGTAGGGNWQGVSFDPQLALVFTNVNHVGAYGKMVKSPVDKIVQYRDGPLAPAMPYGNEKQYAFANFTDPDRRPCNQPPWSELVAVNARTGDIAWRVPLGIDDELEARGIKNTGTVSSGGSIVTAGGLVFIGSTGDGRFWAFDSHTGAVLWSAKMNGNVRATPMTYAGHSGHQYVALGLGALEGSGAKVVAFTIPQ